MSMQLQLWREFKKRRNSTKYPAASADDFKDVLLKENTSLMKPVFIVSSVNWTWNYAWWNGRYYYINDIYSASNNMFELVCELDVLASFRHYIGLYSTLISRTSETTSGTGWDPAVIDDLYPPTGEPLTKEQAYVPISDFTLTRSEGTIVLGTVGQHGSRFYVMSFTEFADVCRYLFPGFSSSLDFATWLNTSITQAEVGGLQSILANIAILHWLPIRFSALTDITATSQSIIYIGNWAVDVHATVADPVLEITGSSLHNILNASYMFKDRDDGGSRGRWEYLSPYASYSIFIPPFGLIPIDGMYLYQSAGTGNNYITVNYDIDILTGNTTMILTAPVRLDPPTDNKIVGTFRTNLAFDVKTGGTSSNVAGIVSTAGSVALAAYTGGASAAVGAIASSAKNLIPETSQIGGGVTGPYPDLTTGVRTYATYFDPIGENRAELGRPLGKVAQISTFQDHFVQTARAKIEIPGHEEEMIKINVMLDEGIFYE